MQYLEQRPRWESAHLQNNITVYPRNEYCLESHYEAVYNGETMVNNSFELLSKYHETVGAAILSFTRQAVLSMNTMLSVTK